MQLDQFSQELRLLIAEGETQQAIERLLGIYNQTKGAYYDELIVIASHHKSLRDKVLAGALDEDDASIQTNAINHSLLQLIDHLAEDKPLLRHFKMDSSKASVVSLPDFKAASSSKKRNWYLGIAVLAIAGGLVLVFLLGQYFGSANKDEVSANVQIPATDTATTTAEQRQPTQDLPQATQQVEKPIMPAEKPAVQAKKKPVEAEKPALADNKNIEQESPTAVVTSPDAEPNNTLAKALALSLPLQQAGLIAHSSDVDCYKITLQVGEQLNVLVSATDKELNPTLEILNENGQSLQRLGARNGAISTFHRPQQAGHYYLRVAGKLQTKGLYLLKASIAEE